MSQGKCVGCGLPLQDARKKKYKANSEQVTCSKCGRIYIYDTKTNKYRRALLAEV
jgi:predicted  nucleic acid-binding Zn-ribbon protein